MRNRLNKKRRKTNLKIKYAFLPVYGQLTFFQKLAADTVSIFFLYDQLQFNLKYDFNTICFRFIVFTVI